MAGSQKPSPTIAPNAGFQKSSQKPTIAPTAGTQKKPHSSQKTTMEPGRYSFQKLRESWSGLSDMIKDRDNLADKDRPVVGKHIETLLKHAMRGKLQDVKSLCYQMIMDRYVYLDHVFAGLIEALVKKHKFNQALFVLTIFLSFSDEGNFFNHPGLPNAIQSVLQNFVLYGSRPVYNLYGDSLNAFIDFLCDSKVYKVTMGVGKIPKDKVNTLIAGINDLATHPGACFFNVLLDFLCKVNRPDKVRQLLTVFRESGMKIEMIDLCGTNGATNACDIYGYATTKFCESGRVDDAANFLQENSVSYHLPYKMVFEYYCTSGRFEDAKEYLKTMNKIGIDVTEHEKNLIDKEDEHKQGWTKWHGKKKQNKLVGVQNCH